MSTPERIAALSVRIFADGADEATMESLATLPWIAGFTTNPSLLRKAGVTDYAGFAQHALTLAGGRPVSFEVLSDEFEEMRRQARVIASWGPAAVVKIPIVNSRGESAASLIEDLAAEGMALNVTAVFDERQVRRIRLNEQCFVSVFAGRLADTGIDPIGAACAVQQSCRAKVIWASTRELFNVLQADAAGCYAITMTPDLLSKMKLFGKAPLEYSRETVAMFVDDAKASGLTL